MTTYLPNNLGVEVPSVTFSEDFENENNAFKGTETVDVDGNSKLNMYAKGGDYRVLQGIGYGIPMFRTKFNVNKTIKSAKIYSSALGVYDLFINGQRVGTSTEDAKVIYDELKPGWTDYRKTVQYSSYDVTNLLTEGSNAVGAQVASGYWNGGISHGDYGNLPLGFIAKLVVNFSDGTSQIVVTDPSWLTSTNGPVRMADIYNGETYDARKESDWTTADFVDSDWLQTTLSTDFNGEIKAFVGPPVQVRPELEILPKTTTVYEGTIASGTTYGAINTVSTFSGDHLVQLKKGQTIIYDLGQNVAGWVKFTAKGEAGAKMTIRFGEMLNDNGASSRGNYGPAGSIYTANLRSAKASINYTFKGSGEDETYHPSLTYFGFRYCEVTANRDIEMSSLVAEVVGSANEEQSSFKTSNEMVNKLYSNIIWGQRSNFVSIPTDYPQRDERLGWMGDAQVFVRTASYNMHVQQFFEKWMRDINDVQTASGDFGVTAPFQIEGYSAGWSDAGVIIPWTIYKVYGDENILSTCYPAMKSYIGFLKAQANNNLILSERHGDWLNVNDETAKDLLSTAYYAYSVLLMAKIASVLGNTSDAQSYSTLFEAIKAAYVKAYITDDGHVKSGSQTAYLLSLHFDLLPTELRDNAAQHLVANIKAHNWHLTTGFLGISYLCPVLSSMGYSDVAYRLLHNETYPSWLYSIKNGANDVGALELLYY